MGALDRAGVHALLRCSDVGRVAEVRVANGEFRGNADGERNVDGDLGVLAGRLLFSIQDELFRRLHGAGFTDLVPRHGAVLAYLRLAGIRATELSRLSGQHKQVIGKNVDELEELGYVERVPDPGDRRAKLVVPTERGRRQMRTADSIMADIADRNRRHLGTEEFDRFLHLFRTIVRHQREAQPNGSAE